MSLEMIQSVKIVDEALKELIIKEIGNGEKDVFLREDSYFKELIDHNILDIASTLKLGECEIDGVKAVKKLGVVYISDNRNLDLVERNRRIYSIVPALKYNKDYIEVTSIEHIAVYNQYKLIIKTDNVKKYDFIIVSYIEAL